MNARSKGKLDYDANSMTVASPIAKTKKIRNFKMRNVNMLPSSNDDSKTKDGDFHATTLEDLQKLYNNAKHNYTITVHTINYDNMFYMSQLIMVIN